MWYRANLARRSSSHLDREVKEEERENGEIDNVKLDGWEHTFCENTGWRPAPYSMLALRGEV